MRAVGIIIKDGKILLIRRLKNGEEYWVFPGGANEQYYKDFLNRLGSELKKISKKEKISYIYLFSPNYMTKMTKSIFPTALRNKVRISISGNFSGHKPMDLMEKITLKRKKII